MARPRRAAPGRLAYHVLNRSSGQRVRFADAGDYAAFERMRVCAYALLACREQKLAKVEELLDDWPVDRPRQWRQLGVESSLRSAGRPKRSQACKGA